MADTDQDPLALDAQLCFALVAAARSVVSVYRPVLEPLGLTHPQYLVMLALWERDPRSISELSAALRLEPATVSPLVKRLEATGYLERSRSAADERVLEVRLTPSGRVLRERAQQVPLAVMDTLGMGIAELTALRDALADFTARIDAAS